MRACHVHAICRLFTDICTGQHHTGIGKTYHGASPRWRRRTATWCDSPHQRLQGDRSRHNHLGQRHILSTLHRRQQPSRNLRVIHRHGDQRIACRLQENHEGDSRVGRTQTLGSDRSGWRLQPSAAPRHGGCIHHHQGRRHTYARHPVNRPDAPGTCGRHDCEQLFSSCGKQPLNQNTRHIDHSRQHRSAVGSGRCDTARPNTSWSERYAHPGHGHAGGQPGVMAQPAWHRKHHRAQGRICNSHLRLKGFKWRYCHHYKKRLQRTYSRAILRQREHTREKGLWTL